MPESFKILTITIEQQDWGIRAIEYLYRGLHWISSLIRKQVYEFLYSLITGFSVNYDGVKLWQCRKRWKRNGIW